MYVSLYYSSNKVKVDLDRKISSSSSSSSSSSMKEILEATLSEDKATNIKSSLNYKDVSSKSALDSRALAQIGIIFKYKLVYYSPVENINPTKLNYMDDEFFK